MQQSQDATMPQDSISDPNKERKRRPNKRYKYTIINSMGKKEKGNFDAESEDDVRNFLLSQDYKVLEETAQGMILLTLKYGEKKERVITNLKRVSKSGLRVYAKSNEIPRVLNGLGIAIISTSKGLMTDKEAREAGLGGEVLAYIW